MGHEWLVKNMGNNRNKFQLQTKVFIAVNMAKGWNLISIKCIIKINTCRNKIVGSAAI